MQHPRGESLSATAERTAERTADTTETVSAVSVSASSEPEAPEAQIVAAESAGDPEGKVIAIPRCFPKQYILRGSYDMCKGVCLI